MAIENSMIAAFLTGCVVMFLVSEFYAHRVRKAEEAVRKQYKERKEKPSAETAKK